MRNLARRIEGAIRAICPELSGTPIYLSFRPSCRILGATHRGMDLVVRGDLPRGRWRGRGVAIILSPGTLARHAGENRPTRRRLFWRTLLETMMHELAHVVDDGLATEADPAFDLPAARECVRDLFGGSEVANNGRGATCPWLYHEAPFIRSCIHLAHRCRGVPDAEHVTVWGIFQAHDYGLSPTAEYADALGDEPDRLRHLSIFDIAKNPAPNAFTDLWRSDVRRWTDQFAETIREEQKKARRIMLENLVAKLRKQREAVLAGYDDIVKALVAGKEPDPEIAARIIFDAGKTEADLLADVERERKRRELQRKAGSIGEITRELGEVDAKLAAAHEKLERAQKAHDDAAAPLLAREKHLQAQLAEAEAARQRLAVDFPSESYQRVASDLAGMLTRAHELRNRIPDLRRDARYAAHCAEGFVSNVDREDAAAKGKRLAAQADSAEKELAALERAIAAAEAAQREAVDALART